MRATKDPVAGVDGSQATLDVQLKPVRNGALGSGWPGRGGEALGGIPHDVQPRELTELQADCYAARDGRELVLGSGRRRPDGVSLGPGRRS